MKHVLVWFVVCAGSIVAGFAVSVALGQVNGEEEPEKRVLRFLQTIAARDEPTAFKELLAGSRLFEGTESVSKLIEQSREIEKRFGTFLGIEKVDEANVGNNVLVLRYLYKCENYPILWTFVFYRAGTADTLREEQWQLVGLKMTTSIDALLELATRSQ